MAKAVKLTPRRMGREWALQFLYQFDLRQSEFEEQELELFWNQLEDSPAMPKGRKRENAQSFANELIRGIVPIIEELDSIISKYSSNWPISRMPVVDRQLLRIGTFEICKQGTAAEVVINEAVEIAKAFGDKDSTKFINAILDQVHKHKSE